MAQEKKNKKYFFNLNDFNEPDPDDLEDEEPPPPTFSEEELATAKKEAYEQGKTDGLAESKASRDQYIASLLSQISNNFSQLFNAEQQREQIFENEAIILAMSAFKKVFPILNEHKGLDEVKAVLLSTLKQFENQSAILIEVHPEDVADIDVHLKTMSPSFENISVMPSEQLTKGSCNMKWKDGGALRNSEQVSQKILSYLEETLAVNAGNVQNGPEEFVNNDKDGDAS